MSSQVRADKPRQPKGISTGGQWTATARAEADLDYLRGLLDETPTNDLGTGDDLSRLYHGTSASPEEIATWGLLPGDGLSNEGMLGGDEDGEDIAAGVFLTPVREEAAEYGDRVYVVDARDYDLIAVDGFHGLHYVATEPISAKHLTGPPRSVRGADLPPLVFSHEAPFDPDLIDPVVNEAHNKPAGGLWLSPGTPGQPSGWDEWCQRAEHRRPERHSSAPVGLSDDAKVALIDSREDLLALAAHYPAPRRPGAMSEAPFDFEAAAQDYDAVWLTPAGESANRRPADDGPHTYAWDIESVLVLRIDSLTH